MEKKKQENRNGKQVRFKNKILRNGKNDVIREEYSVSGGREEIGEE